MPHSMPILTWLCYTKWRWCCRWIGCVEIWCNVRRWIRQQQAQFWTEWWYHRCRNIQIDVAMCRACSTVRIARLFAADRWEILIEMRYEWRWIQMLGYIYQKARIWYIFSAIKILNDFSIERWVRDKKQQLFLFYKWNGKNGAHPMMYCSLLNIPWNYFQVVSASLERQSFELNFGIGRHLDRHPLGWWYILHHWMWHCVACVYCVYFSSFWHRL